MRAALAAAAAALALALSAGTADASFDACTYDAGTRTATASLVTSQEGTLSVGAGGEIVADAIPCGAATTANTDDVVVTGTDRQDVVTIDLSGPGGPFEAPGTGEEVHLHMALGDDQCTCAAEAQRVAVIGTTGSDHIVVGQDFVNGNDTGPWRANFDADEDLDPDLTSGDPVREVDGGAGDDTISGLGGSGTGIAPVTLTMTGGTGDDTLVAGGDRDFVYPGPGSDQVRGSPEGRGTAVSYADLPTGIETSFDGGEVVDGDGATDFLSRDVRRLIGSEHDDTLRADDTFGAYVLDGAGGDDTVVGGPYQDGLSGGAGDDIVEGARGYTEEDGPGYSFEGDSLDGGPGADVLRGTPHGDSLDGGPGPDRLNARRGEDHLNGGPGDDLLLGGFGSDSYGFGRPAGREHDTLNDMGGRHDALDLSYSTGHYGAPVAPLTIDLAAKGRRFGVRGRRTLLTRFPGTARFFEDVSGTTAGDRIAGSRARNRITAGGGDDTIDCRRGRDTVVEASADARLYNCEFLE